MTTRDAKAAAIYCRISSDPQGERAGVERQQTDCEALAARLGVDVVATYVDNDVSAYSGKRRPEFEQMLTDAAAGDFQLVICWATDRLYRRMTDLTRITDELAPFATIAAVNGGEIDLETSEGILRAQVLGSVAEFESRRKSERIAARAKQRAEGGVMFTSERPFGWTWAKPCPGGSDCTHRADCHGKAPVYGSRAGLVPHPLEAPALIDTYRRIAAGATLHSQRKRLRQAGFTRSVKGLGNVLRHPRNAGLVSHNGVIVAEADLAIIDRETWEQVQAILTDPARRTSPGRPANTILGGGLLRCGMCGGPMASGRKRVNPTYICSRNRCAYRKRSAIDDPVLTEVGNLIAALAANGALHLPAAEDGHVDSLRASIAADEDRLEALAGLMASGDLDPADYAKAAGRIRRNLTDATAAMTKRANRPALAALGNDPVTAWTQRRTDAQAGDIEWMRAALAELIESITLDEAKIITIHWRPWVGPWPNRIDARGDVRSPESHIRARREQVRVMTVEGVTGVEIAKRLKVNRATVVHDLKLLRGDGELTR